MKDKVLTIEQINYLKSIGVDTSDGKIYWHVYTTDAKGNPTKKNERTPFLSLNSSGGMKVGFQRFEITPTYTSDDILNKLPKFIHLNGKTYFLSVLYDGTAGVVITYSEEHLMNPYHSVHGHTLLEASFKMLEYVVLNKDIKL